MCEVIKLSESMDGVIIDYRLLAKKANKKQQNMLPCFLCQIRI